MTTHTTSLIDFVFEIANKLRGLCRPPQYRKVMLPMTVLRRLDGVLAPTREQSFLVGYRQRGGSCGIGRGSGRSGGIRGAGLRANNEP